MERVNFNGVKNSIKQLASMTAAEELRTQKTAEELIKETDFLQRFDINLVTEKTDLWRARNLLENPALQNLTLRDTNGHALAAFKEVVKENIDTVETIVDKIPDLIQHYNKNVEKIAALTDAQQQLEDKNAKQLDVLIQVAIKQLEEKLKK